MKGYFAWSLTDNFEWSAGYYPKFGFFSFDPARSRATSAQRAVFHELRGSERSSGIAPRTAKGGPCTSESER